MNLKEWQDNIEKILFKGNGQKSVLERLGRLEVAWKVSAGLIISLQVAILVKLFMGVA